MADKKLFELELKTPVDSDNIVFGQSGHTYYNVSMSDFKTFLLGGESIVKTKIFEIGAWNMKIMLLPFAIVNITPIEIQKIRGINVIIRNDNDDEYIDFLAVQNGNIPSSPMVNGFINGTTHGIILTVRSNSYFDGTSFQKLSNPDSTAYNRGWVTVTYVD